VLISVFIAEFGFKIKPCEWCIYQRYPYVFLLSLNLIWCFKPLSAIAQSLVNTFILTVNATLPLIHVLIEKGYIYVKCSVLKPDENKSLLSMLDILSAHRSCVKINWTFLSWSMAQWHLLFASGILILYVWGVIYVQKRYSSNYTC
jgi:disulfide bond formation protein DsbB